MKAVKIRYKFQGESEYTVCIVTRLQYENFKILPIMEECKIIKEDMEISETEIEKMNHALSEAIRKDLF